MDFNRDFDEREGNEGLELRKSGKKFLGGMLAAAVGIPTSRKIGEKWGIPFCYL